ncbi:MAG: MarR family winged helix-turn-helix transcriptional regulator [Candidatus Dormibacteraceae bacterium]
MVEASKKSIAAAAWRPIFDLIVSTAPERDLFIRRLGLSPAESRALASLDPTRGRPMRVLAREWGCDPSNATWLVDRLERQGLASREIVEADRRVKSVVLTPKGARLRVRLLEAFYRPPEILAAMPRTDLESLRRAATKLPKSVPLEEQENGHRAVPRTRR